MRADRLISLLLYMQGRPRVTASEIATELEVSVATARRDLGALSSAGVPVYAQAGRHGGWSLLGGARTDLTGLSGPEARALFALVGAGDGVPAEAASALRKLVRALPATFREDAVAASRSIVVDPSGWGGADTADETPFAGVIRSAVIERRRTVISYATPGRIAADRVVEPWGLVDKDATWYLIAGTDRGRRTFRLDRIAAVRVSEERFHRPPGFDLGAAWREVVAEVETRRARVSCTVRLPERFVFVLDGQFGRHCTPIDTDGDVATVRLSASSVLDLARTLAGWGDELQVLEPPAVRRELGRIGRELAAAYGTS